MFVRIGSDNYGWKIIKEFVNNIVIYGRK
jgi:hypothetical protein